MSTRYAHTLMAALATALFLTACGDAAPDRRETPADTGAAALETRPGTGPASTETGITADVAVEDQGDRVSLRVTLDGLVPDANYPVNVHDGGCDANGRVRLPMGQVTGRRDGTGSVRMTLAVGRLPDRPFSVRVLDPEGTPAACAQLDTEPRDIP